MIHHVIATIVASLIIIDGASADCSRPIYVGEDGIGYMLDGPIWWLMQDHVVADAAAFEVINGLWFIVEVEHGPGAPAVPSVFLDLTFAHQLLAVAIYSPGHGGSGGSFLVVTTSPPLGGLTYGEPELPGMITILYDDTGDCITDSEFVMPMLGPIPDDCPVEAWLHHVPRGTSVAEAAQAVADSYVAAPD